MWLMMTNPLLHRWADWGEYLNAMSGMDIPFDPPPPSM